MEVMSFILGLGAMYLVFSILVEILKKLLDNIPTLKKFVGEKISNDLQKHL
jgi:hypothetical protein